jgi:RNA 2',3'-cyclic 3'-phosphodiesterase
MIRAFVGIPLAGDVADVLAAAQAGMPLGREVPQDNFHVTLAFLGEQPRPVVEEAHHALDAVRAPSFPLRIEGLGMFGGARPRVLYAEVAPEPALAHLHRKVLRAVHEAGIELARQRFRPHVTLARFGNDGLRGEEVAEMQAFVARRVGLRAGPFEVDRFVLYRSHLGRAGAIYEPLAEYPLGTPQPAADGD